MPAIWCMSGACEMVSNALLKSKLSTWTYGFDFRSAETLSSSEMSADVVDPVGRKAYWSLSMGMSEYGGESSSG